MLEYGDDMTPDFHVKTGTAKRHFSPPIDYGHLAQECVKMEENLRTCKANSNISRFNDLRPRIRLLRFLLDLAPIATHIEHKVAPACSSDPSASSGPLHSMRTDVVELLESLTRPREDKGRLLEDVHSNLETVRNWLFMLQPYLPDTATWLANLNRMSKFELRSAYEFYKANLLQVKKHVKTLSTITRALHTLKSTTDMDTDNTMQIAQVEHLALSLESACHLQWLHLLELTICIDKNYLSSLNSPPQLGHPIGPADKTDRSQSVSSLVFSPAERDSKLGNAWVYNPFSIVFNPFEETLPLEDSSIKDFNPRPTSTEFLDGGRESEPHPNNHSTNGQFSSAERLLTCESVSTLRIPTSDQINPKQPDQEYDSAVFTDILRNRSFDLSTKPVHRLQTDFAYSPTPAIASVRENRLSLPEFLDTDDCIHDTTKSFRQPDFANAKLSRASSSPCFLSSFNFFPREHKKTINLSPRHRSFVAPYVCTLESNLSDPRFCTQLNNIVHNLGLYEMEQLSGHLDEFRSPCFSSSEPLLTVGHRPQKETELLTTTRPNKSTENVNRRRKRSHPPLYSTWKHAQSNSGGSSVDGDASDLERKRWKNRVRSYLDAATHAEELIRRQQVSSDLRAWLNTLGPTLFDETSPQVHQNGVAISKEENSLLQLSERHNLAVESHLPAYPNPKNVDFFKRSGSQEPLMSFWDDYQAPLYSSSSEADHCEPVGIFAEEFPWDDVGDSCASDLGVIDSTLPELPGDSKMDHAEYIPFRSPLTTLAQADNSDEHIPDTSFGCKQDTMDLSTTTSVIFNQKSSSVDVSFEVCSPSVVTATSQTGDFGPVDVGDNLDCASLPHGLRTHPDGGSQLKIDYDSTFQTPAQQTQQKSEHLFFSADRLPFCGRFKSGTQCPSFHRWRKQGLRAYSQPPNGRTFIRRCSSRALIDDSIHLSDANCLHADALECSRNRLKDISNSLYRFLNTKDKSERCTTGSIVSPHSSWNAVVKQWQNELSNLIHLAETELCLFFESAGDWNYSRPTWNRYLSTPPARSSPGLHKHCAAHLDRIKLIEEARKWLLRSCSDESIRRRLCSLRARVTDATECAQHLIRLPGGVQGARFSDGDCLSSESSEFRTLKLTAARLESITEQLDRLHALLDRRLTMLDESAHSTGMPEVVVLFAASNADLRQQLDQLQVDAIVLQTQLSERLNQYASSSQSPRCTQSVYGAEQDCRIESRGVHFNANLASHAQPIQLTHIDTTSTFLKRSHFFRFFLVASGVFISTCCCCYVIAQYFPNNKISPNWRSATHLIEQLLHPILGSTESTCPSSRGGVSTFIDLIPGLVPF